MFLRSKLPAYPLEGPDPTNVSSHESQPSCATPALIPWTGLVSWPHTRFAKSCVCPTYISRTQHLAKHVRGHKTKMTQCAYTSKCARNDRAVQLAGVYSGLQL
eukprot:1157459-Pelagomonas_calceolata.AAC.2